MGAHAVTGLTDLARSAIAGRRFLGGDLTPPHLTESEVAVEVEAPAAPPGRVHKLDLQGTYARIVQATAAQVQEAMKSPGAMLTTGPKVIVNAPLGLVGGTWVFSANAATGLIGSTGGGLAAEPALTRVSFEWAFALYQQDVQPDVITEMRRRMAEMLGDESWEPGDVLPSRDSLDHMLWFFRMHRDLRPPALTISSKGNLVATWLHGPSELVRLEFGKAPMLTWLVLGAPGDESTPSKGTGTLPSLRAKEALSPYRVWAWVVRPHGGR
jgi:hypothetical protein